MQYESKDGTIMMLPADVALVQDPAFRAIVDEFARNEEVFFKEFSSAFAKLLELGVPFPTGCSFCNGQKSGTGLFGWGWWGIL